MSDVYPTFAEAAGVSAGDLAASSAKGPAPLDGVSLWAVLRDPAASSPRTEVLISGQHWKVGAPLHAAAQQPPPPPLTCSSSRKPSGLAYFKPRSLSNFQAPNAACRRPSSVRFFPVFWSFFCSSVSEVCRRSCWVLTSLCKRTMHAALDLTPRFLSLASRRPQQRQTSAQKSAARLQIAAHGCSTRRCTSDHRARPTNPAAG